MQRIQNTSKGTENNPPLATKEVESCCNSPKKSDELHSAQLGSMKDLLTKPFISDQDRRGKLD